MNTQTNVDVNWVRSEKRSDSSLVRIVFDVVLCVLSNLMHLQQNY
jgi:hypothetical protein